MVQVKKKINEFAIGELTISKVNGFDNRWYRTRTEARNTLLKYLGDLIMADKKYTPEELAAFKRKDILSAKQSAVKATSMVLEGTNTDVKEFLAYAEKVRKWLWEDQEIDEPKKETKKAEANSETSSDYPTPTVAQKKILDVICERVGKTESEVYPRVLEWSKTVAKDGKPTYPQKEASIEKFIEWNSNN